MNTFINSNRDHYTNVQNCKSKPFIYAYIVISNGA